MSDITKRVDKLPLDAQVKALTKALEHIVVLSTALERQRKINRCDSRYYSHQGKMLKLAWKGLVEAGLEDYNEELKEYLHGVEFQLNIPKDSNDE